MATRRLLLLLLFALFSVDQPPPPSRRSTTKYVRCIDLCAPARLRGCVCVCGACSLSIFIIKNYMWSLNQQEIKPNQMDKKLKSTQRLLSVLDVARALIVHKTHTWDRALCVLGAHACPRVRRSLDTFVFFCGGCKNATIRTLSLCTQCQTCPTCRQANETNTTNQQKINARWYLQYANSARHYTEMCKCTAARAFRRQVDGYIENG